MRPVSHAMILFFYSTCVTAYKHYRASLLTTLLVQQTFLFCYLLQLFLFAVGRGIQCKRPPLLLCLPQQVRHQAPLLLIYNV